ncbi:trypsin-like serine protease [Simiduia curdlanivorans]|uniref:S1 family peptidase n=1 Tax=Simiduia curdlanivorans TaxID=1492769 RepID=A0ABV8V3B0_9GAMM|nr:trypsin-like serine protease [Simiduia curdlanivorans]MDN3640963.1 trypsin-like serine protease [Simiduia curdlanivorans]
MNITQCIVLTVGLSSSLASAIVIRHDVPDESYHAARSDFPPLATLYSIGVHGTLIDPEWVVTAAHAVFCMNPGQKIHVGNELVSVSQRYSYPEYQLGGVHDLALIKLAQPVTSIKPATLYDGIAEKGAGVWFIGVGGTGTGQQGQTVSYKENNGRLRKAQNKVVNVTDTDIVFKFERGSKGEALEGVSGNGDSGGPAFIKEGDKYVLLGVSSRVDSWFYNVGEYGVTELYTRVSSYSDWIQQVISAKDELTREKITTQNAFLQDGMKSMNMNELCASLEVK